MMNLKLLFLMMIFAVATAKAQDIVPATNEDISRFDEMMKQAHDRQESATRGSDGLAHNKRNDSKEKKSNFGKTVSARAHSAKGSKSSKEDFGKWVSEQRAKSERGGHGAEVSPSKEVSDQIKDGRNSESESKEKEDSHGDASDDRRPDDN